MTLLSTSEKIPYLHKTRLTRAASKALGRIASVLFLIVTLSGCTATVKQIRYQPELQAFEGTTTADTSRTTDRGWFILRHPETYEIIRDSTQLNQLSQPITRIPAIWAGLQKPAHASVFAQYLAGKKYFEGARALAGGDLQDGQQDLAEALQEDPGLRYFSDIHYLQAICFQEQGLIDSAEESLRQFVAYSEALIPTSFYVSSPDMGATYRTLLSHEPDSLARQLYDGHITTRYEGPALYPIYYYGFISRNMPGLGLMIGGHTGGAEGARLTGEIELWPTEKFTIFVGKTLYEAEPRIYYGTGYQLYRSWDQRYGLTAYVIAGETEYTFENDTTISFINWSPRLMAGYRPIPRIALFCGLQYYAYNESHNYQETIDGIRYQVWQNNSVFCGGTFFLHDQIGLTARWHSELGFETGIYFLGMQLYNFFKAPD